MTQIEDPYNIKKSTKTARYGIDYQTDTVDTVRCLKFKKLGIEYQAIRNRILRIIRIPSSTLILTQLIVVQLVGFIVFYLDTHLTHLVICSVPLASILKLVKMKTQTEKLPFKAATLNDRGGDLAQRWYIQFWVWSDIERKTVRKWDYAINKENGKDETDTLRIRRAYAKARIKSINDLLQDGYHISDKVEEKSIDMTVRTAMEYALKISGLKGGSYNSYSSCMNIFLEWARVNSFDTINLDKFKRKDAYQYIDWRVSNGIKGTTVNNDVSYIKRLWSILKKRELIQVNPFSELEKQKEERSLRNMAYTDADIELLKSDISVADPELWSFIQIIYNTFARPNEIRQLKVSDIRLSERLIYIDASISKNNKSEFVTIPDSLLDTIIDLISVKSSGDWLFPGTKNCVSKNRMNDRHSKFLTKHKFSEDHTLYSWKHTGVVRAYKAGVDLKRIQLQCRHGSIQQTDTYLKSMGLYENLEIKLKMPSL